MTTQLTLVDDKGLAIWGVYFKSEDVRVTDLIRAGNAGALDGDPRRPYLILQVEVRNGVLRDWQTLLDAWEVLEHVLAGIVVTGGAIEVARRVIDRLKSRTRESQEVLAGHYQGWSDRGARPDNFVEFLTSRSWSTPELAGLLGCPENDAEAVLWAFGFAHGQDGRWHLAATEEAKLLKDNYEAMTGSCPRSARHGRERRASQALSGGGEHLLENSTRPTRPATSCETRPLPGPSSCFASVESTSSMTAR